MRVYQPRARFKLELCGFRRRFFSFYEGFGTEFAFHAAHQEGGRGVTHHVDGRTDHVEDTVDAREETHHFERNTDLREDQGGHNQTGTRDASRTDGGEHTRENHDHLIRERERNAVDLRGKDRRHTHVNGRTVHVDGVGERYRKGCDGFGSTQAAGGDEVRGHGGGGRAGREGDQPRFKDALEVLHHRQLDDELHQGDVDDDHKKRRSDEGREDQLA